MTEKKPLNMKIVCPDCASEDISYGNILTVRTTTGMKNRQLIQCKDCSIEFENEFVTQFCQICGELLKGQ